MIANRVPHHRNTSRALRRGSLFGLVDRMLADAGVPSALQPAARPVYEAKYPALDVRRSEGALEVHAELPGMRPEDIHVTLQGNALVIRGEKRTGYDEPKGASAPGAESAAQSTGSATDSAKGTAEGGFIVRERSHTSFVRRVALPDAVDEEGVRARFADGVLHLTLPVAQPVEPQVRRIEIASGDSEPNDSNSDDARQTVS